MPETTLASALAPLLGARTANALKRAFGYTTVGELLQHFPRRYHLRGELTPLAQLPLEEEVTVVARIESVRERQMRSRKGTMLEARITDGTGHLLLTFFNQPFRARELLAGRTGMFAGKVREYRGQRQLAHPDYELFAIGQENDHAAQDAKEWADTPVPVYPAAGNMPSWIIARSVGLVLDAFAQRPLPDPLPAELVREENILPFMDALELIHRPTEPGDFKRARASLKLLEALELQLSLVQRRRKYGAAQGIARPPQEAGVLAQFDAALPFQLTAEQQQVGEVIAGELARQQPMHRLLQGEVGAGKTLVALRAMLQVADAGGQSALLAPTEVLAAQHLSSIREALGEQLTAALHPVLLTGRLGSKERRKALLDIASGVAKIVIGTHALFSDGVSFADLGLTVIDEQHRFGVEQRDALRAKGKQPHVLAMTATPIPRTVALTAFGDLEVLTLKQLPPGRQGIQSFVVPELENPQMAGRVWQRALEELRAGRQVYVVCPAIATAADSATLEDSGDADELPLTDEFARQKPLASVTATVAELQSVPEFAKHGVAALHGQLAGDAKDQVMRGFAAGEIGLLVATTVVEVGVNVPNATMMIVRDADRFGMSQLHQLRGRVGRGQHPGLCLLLTCAPPGTVARERIEQVAASADGFQLAEADLELRREGDILGTRQSGGRSGLRLLRVARDGALIQHAREVAERLLAADPLLESAPLLAARLAAQEESGRLAALEKS